MGLFKNNRLVQKITDWKKNRKKLQEEDFEENWSEITGGREEVDIHNATQRKAYVKGCLEQMAEAARELESLNFEYGMVTSYLKDMEEIEALPEADRKELQDCAQKIENLEGQRGVYLEKKNRMSEEKFHQMERMEDDAEEGLKKLTDAEEYQEKIRQDLSRLEGEKHAYFFRKSELQGAVADSRGMAVICSAAFGICLIALLILRYAMEMETQIGFMLTAAAAALIITVIYIRYSESVKELKMVENGISRIIMLQNRTKIRYVNNTNLLDYLYLKYKVSSAGELRKLWDNYNLEKEERKKYRAAELELDDSQQELLNILKCYQVKDPAIWLHQTAAILDSKEMVEIRHNLIIRRQSLRKRIDYNKEVVATRAQEEIKFLVESYPQYAREILSEVDEYGKDFS